MDERLLPGTGVTVRGDRWTVTAVAAHGACTSVQLHGCGAANVGVRRTLLAPFDRMKRMPTGVTVTRPRAWLRTVRRLMATAHPFNGLQAAALGRIEILPYQLAPVLAIRAGSTRVLIADAVGLGKTVQAGLVLNDLAVRGGSCRALIAAPAGLLEQWASELASHFSLPTIVAGAAWLARICRELPPGINPWILPSTYIASFDFLKRPEVLRPLEEVTWDALVVDEAHNASLGTARRAAIHEIATRSGRVLLLTATPHSGDPAQFDALCRIGELDAAEPLAIFRRSRQDAGAGRPRRSVLLPVRLSPAEQRMHRLLDHYTGRVCREARARGDSRARLAAIVLRKRALSSAASLAASADRRLELLAAVTPSERQLMLPLADEDDLPDQEPDDILAAPGLSDAAEERRLLRRISDIASIASGAEAKTRTLVRFLVRAREPAIVFTEYRDTLARLQRALESAGLRTSAIHGGQSPAERAVVQRDFNERGVLLLATDAAAEGLNLQARCRIVVHYELPWSPARIEQRTGRVDRIGQHRIVHEVLLVARDTAERLVLAPLARRAARARSALPGSSHVLELLTESRIAAAVMDGAPLEGSPDQASSAAVAGPAREVQAEAARLRAIRGWMEEDPPRMQRAGPIVTLARRGSPGAICIYRVSLAGPDGLARHVEFVAIRDGLADPPASTTPAAVRGAFNRWLEHREANVRQVVATQTAAVMAEANERHRVSLGAFERRARAVARIRTSASRELVQAGLFDNRALRAHPPRRRASGSLLEEWGALNDSPGTAQSLSTSIELTALLWRRARTAAP